MTDEPSDHRDRSRSDAASRLAALLSDLDADSAPPEVPQTRSIRPRHPEGGERSPDGPGADDVDLSALDSLLRDLPQTARPPSVDDMPTIRGLGAPAAASPEASPDLPDLTLPSHPSPPPVAPEDVPVLHVPPAPDPAEPADDGSGDEDEATRPFAVLDHLAVPPAPADAPDASDGADEVPAIVTDGLVAPGVDSDRTVAFSTPESVPFPEPPPDPPRPVGLRPASAEAVPDDADDADDAVADLGHEPRLRRVTARAAVFTVLLLILVAAIPALGLQGKDRVLASRGGQVVSGSRDPTQPGYRALVEPTPTALVVQRAADGAPLSLTMLSLGAGASGGTVLQIPLQTAVRTPYYYLDRLQTVYDFDENDDQLFRAVEDRIGTAIGERIDVDDDSIAALVGPVAPLTIDNPDPVATPEGDTFAAGPLTLTAEQVGPFLRATSEGESELGHLARTEVVWSAWLSAIGAAGTEDSVGAATTGIGPFLRVLAEGTVAEPTTTMVTTLDVVPPEMTDVTDPPLVPSPDMEEQIADAVPFPRTPSLGRRIVVELLNGVDGSEIPSETMHDLVVAGAAINKLGNAAEFGADTTTIEITNEGWRESAEALKAVLGPDVEIKVLGPEVVATLDVDAVVTLGDDVLGGG